MRPLNSKSALMRRLVMAGAVLATLAGIGAAPALADDWGHRGDDWGHRGDGWRHDEGRGEAWREHEWREHEWRERHAYAYGWPRYYYAPGYSYYAPPPVVYPPAYVAPGLNLGFYFR
ncbi:MAG TPA: hypothetical protein VJO12_08385 [Stellaceae bacterium]|nr:hypothetical protein [Stellaceae bacterium]